MDTKTLIQLALAARQKAYAHYSGFKVGAALLTENGTAFDGCNIENAAYSCTNCAERTAFFKAVSEGVTKFTAIAIVGGSGEIPNKPCSPCGVCRQVMLEFCDYDEFDVIMAVNTDEYEIVKLKDLMPYSFSPRDLYNAIKKSSS